MLVIYLLSSQMITNISNDEKCCCFKMFNYNYAKNINHFKNYNLK